MPIIGLYCPGIRRCGVLPADVPADAFSESGQRFLFEERLLSSEALKVCQIVSTEQSVCMARVGRGVFDGPSLIFPYFDQEGRLVSVQSRYLGKPKSESFFDMEKVSIDEVKPKEDPHSSLHQESSHQIWARPIEGLSSW